MARYEDKAACPPAQLPVWTEEALLAKAREYVANGIAFLDKHVPGGVDRIRSARVLDVKTTDYCALANACGGQEINGEWCFTAGDAVRAFHGHDLSNPLMGFYDVRRITYDVSGLRMYLPPVTYDHLQKAWEEALGRGLVLKDA